ncbi:uncharacterized protein PGTG_07008 [Puccinia graminis f. sp. tritici CRL 75-36-700-3]|uniref:Uncharacterized protein n=1 Tax=Puccinia graminis f. sp. tritici (strain CRL 75-36-700-3 / race SCCL) TaxID=418459 RepID=E3KAF7_PUCGT|nr:uncharacterized protein PGTG_07008 [Puccinia graminis f. sp. tritici CRL 75-36-700-3]EFP81387.2 hypothetical protein PGTG_07008 [Puccinia graminis f. sp. tritici CRL 75-36-700-3]
MQEVEEIRGGCRWVDPYLIASPASSCSSVARHAGLPKLATIPLGASPVIVQFTLRSSTMCGRQLYEDRHFSVYMTEQEMRKVLFINETPKLNAKRCPGVQNSSNAKDYNCANSVPVDPTAKLGMPQVPRRRSSSAQDDHKHRYILYKPFSIALPN